VRRPSSPIDLRREHHDVGLTRKPSRFKLACELRDDVEASRLSGLRQSAGKRYFDRIRWANAWSTGVRIDRVSRTFGRVLRSLASTRL
jgi:hypothetical protein